MNSLSTSDRRILRVGAVTYLNTKPLVYGLEQGVRGMQLSYDYPSSLADQLDAGTIDVGLIPSIEYLRHPEYRIVSDACIACRGPVLSVQLLSRVPFPEIRSLALDAGSRTSVLLARLLLWERFRIEPETSRLPVDASPSAADADAVLVIGDRAIHAAGSGFAHAWDLGAEWYRWAGLPFVFAMWFARPGIDTRRIGALLGRSRDAGLEHLQEIAEVHAESVGLTVPRARAYLQRHLHFRLGNPERRGLEKYCAWVSGRGGLSAAAGIERNDCTTA